MNRVQLISTIATRTGLTQDAVDQVLTALNGVVATQLVAGDKVTIPGFISFEAVQRAARTGRNPATGAPIDIPAKQVVKVVAGAGLKRAVAGE